MRCFLCFLLLVCALAAALAVSPVQAKQDALRDAMDAYTRKTDARINAMEELLSTLVRQMDHDIKQMEYRLTAAEVEIEVHVVQDFLKNE